jgi:hypothetical protein
MIDLLLRDFLIALGIIGIVILFIVATSYPDE